MTYKVIKPFVVYTTNDTSEYYLKFKEGSYINFIDSFIPFWAQTIFERIHPDDMDQFLDRLEAVEDKTTREISALNGKNKLLKRVLIPYNKKDTAIFIKEEADKFNNK